ncbi:Ribonuclease H-like superfamily [Sesbania bispinosa]|nr:Ribonuclease H-like superfamily [Sesbania bispinosa]
MFGCIAADIDWIKLNYDGAVNPSHQLAACAGVFRNHHSIFLMAFAQCLAYVSILEAELSAVLYGIERAWAMRIPRLIVETDYANVVRLILLGCNETNLVFNIVQRIQDLMGKDWMVRIHHIFREANQPVDVLAGHCLRQSNSELLFSSITTFLSLSINVDYLGTCFS